jgi:glyoxylate/hydroxypyruvate reductase A
VSEARPSLLVALAPDAAPDAWVDAFREHAPAFAITTLDGGTPPGDIRYVAAWKHPHGSLSAYPALKAVFSLGAGVDHLLADAALPAGVPVVRVVDPDLTNRMSEWVALHVLMHHRQQRLYDYQQFEKIWADDALQPAAKDVRVGIMGLGIMGQDAARKLTVLGFDVAGWSRGCKTLEGIATFAGDAERAAFLARTDILVVLLPLTPVTRGILGADLFAGLARDGFFGGAILINAGRGGLQDEAAILAALEDGTLRAATLDVFETEPLPQASPLWHHPAVTVTPHNAAISNPDAVARFIAGEIARFEAGGTSAHAVDLAARY